MVRKKSRKSVKKIEKKAETEKSNNFFVRVKWGESYTSLILGFLVVIIATALLFTFVKGKGMIESGSTDTAPAINQEKAANKTYEVKSGDNLWGIAEKEYGSGYNWVDIASANKLTDPEIIYEGTKIVIPNVKQRGADSEFVETVNSQPQNVEVEINEVPVDKVISNSRSITGNSYTVVSGDFLWDIAIRAYGDGYRWTDIAQANNLANPDMIFSENVLKIPR